MGCLLELVAKCLAVFQVTVDTSLCAPPGVVLDLTHPLSNDTLGWPGDKEFSLIPVFRGRLDNGNWYYINNYEGVEHSGTHMDAPAHFYKGGWTIDQIPPERFIAPAVVIDITEKAAQNPDAELSVTDIIHWENAFGLIPDGSYVFMFSNWAERWSDPEGFLGSINNPNDLHFPGFSVCAAQWLIDNRNIFAIGVDTASLDFGQSTDFGVHTNMFRESIFGMENVNNLNELPPKGAIVYAFPMQIEGGSGAPCRIIARVPRSSVESSASRDTESSSE